MSSYTSKDEKIEKMTKAELKKYVKDNLRFGKVISIEFEEEDDDEQDFREAGYS